jgi:hypothetical protein
MLRWSRIFELFFGIILLIAAIASIAANHAGAGIFLGVMLVILALLCFFVWWMTQEFSPLVAQRQYEAAKRRIFPWMLIGFLCVGLPGLFLLIAYLKFDPLINWQRLGYGSMMPGSGMPANMPAYAAPAAAASAAPAAAPAPAPWMETPAPTPEPSTPSPAYTPPPMPTPAASAPAPTPAPSYTPPVAATSAPVETPAVAPVAAAPAPVYVPLGAAAASPTPAYASPPMAAPVAPAPAPAPLCPKCGRATTYIVQYNRYYCYPDQLYV